MIQRKNQNIYKDMNNLYIFAMFEFFPASEFKWVGPKNFDSNKYDSVCPNFCLLEVFLFTLKNYVNYIMIII